MNRIRASGSDLTHTDLSACTAFLNFEKGFNAMKEEKIPGILSGISGEYFVAAELSQRGYIASITLRNTQGVDILAANRNASKSVAIQVKTNQEGRFKWALNKKAEDYSSDHLFYVFVDLKGRTSRSEFHIVPSDVVANQVKKEHREWLKTPGKKGQPHKDNPMRIFRDEECKYLEAWDLLGL